MLMIAGSIAALSTLPAGLYLLVEKVLLHRNTPVVGGRFVIVPCLVSEHDGF